MTVTAFEHVSPADIERRSMQIIDEELARLGIVLDPAHAPVVKRAIHTSADFDYAANLAFVPGGDRPPRYADLVRGATIVCDTNMALAGVNKPALARLGGQALCFMADDDVAEAAREAGTTRAIASMDKAARLFGDAGAPLVFAVGNAPTALARICRLVETHALRPALVVGAPVGFVNVVASKELAIRTCADHGIPAIVARGRKGGSNVAAAIVNALLYEAGGR